MKRTIAYCAAAAVALAPTVAFAQPAPGSISPNHVTGQQVGDFVIGGGLECDEGGVPPGDSTRQHTAGQGSPFQEDSVSGAHYAGEQDGINNKNTTSVSQYDLACFKGPQ
jgi:hypothetical protein